MSNTSSEFRKQFKAFLAKGLEECSLSLPKETQEKLFVYFQALREFAGPLGLTALKDPKDLVVKHLLDSLLVLPFLPKGPLLDLGTGAGLPGMIIKLVEPEREVWLADARKKAISFLFYVTGLLSLKDLKIVQAHVGKNDPLPRHYFGVVVSRAVTDLSSLWALAKPLLREDGHLVAMKGPKVQAEIKELTKKYPYLKIRPYSLNLPLTKDPRTIVVITT